MSSRDALKDQIIKKAVVHGKVILSSGKEAAVLEAFVATLSISEEVPLTRKKAVKKRPVKKAAKKKAVKKKK